MTAPDSGVQSSCDADGHASPGST